MNFLPYSAHFDQIARIENGRVWRHFLVDRQAGDYLYIEQIAIEKALQGKKVEILPTLGNVQDPFRKILFPDAYFAKSPDLRIDGELWEVEQPTTIRLNTIKHCIDEAASQAANIIVNLLQQLDNSFMYRIANGRFKDHRKLENIEFRYNGTYVRFSRR